MPTFIPQSLQASGQLGAAVAGGGTGGAVVTSAAGGAASGVSLAAAGAATSTAAITGAVTFGIGVVLAVGIALWAKHKARIAGAKTENARLNMIVDSFIQTIQQIFVQLNAGQINPQTAIQAIAEIQVECEQAIGQSQSGPGQKAHPCNPITGQWWNNIKGSTSCTAGCFIECNWLLPACQNAAQLIIDYTKCWTGRNLKNTNPHAFAIPAIPANKYGFVATPAFVIQYMGAPLATNLVVKQSGGGANKSTLGITTLNSQTPSTPSTAIAPTPGVPTAAVATAPATKSNLPLIAAGGLLAVKLAGFL